MSLLRLMKLLKQVNEKFAINLLGEEPISVVKGTHVWCDGGESTVCLYSIHVTCLQEMKLWVTQRFISTW